VVGLEYRLVPLWLRRISLYRSLRSNSSIYGMQPHRDCMAHRPTPNLCIRNDLAVNYIASGMLGRVLRTSVSISTLHSECFDFTGTYC